VVIATRTFRVPQEAVQPVHELRSTHAGIRYLRQSDKFKEYMFSRLGLNKKFIAWDGEGWTTTQGSHHYMLFGNSEGDYIQAPQLSTRDCLDLLLRSAGENKNAKNQSTAIHIIYGGGYDATHILRDLPTVKMDELRDTGSCEYFVDPLDGVRANHYHIEYIPHKWLTIKGRDHATGKRTHIKLFDIMTFFQMSAITAWESREIQVPEVIKSGKASRGGFKYADIDEVKTYWAVELEMYVELSNVLRDEFTEAGIHVTQFHGPGAVASAVFKQYGVKQHMQEPPSLEIEVACQHAYFGGRFEQFKAGHYEGKVYIADINSAYPHHIRNLPSLAGAQWIKTTHYDPDVLGVWFCEFDDDSPDHTKPYPLPWRDKSGSVGFPANNSGVWLWHPEAKYATHVHHGYIIIPATDEKPFAFVPEMYERRKLWKALKRGGEKALKLALNSLYGKMAQRIGGRDGERPSWHQLAWAGMVTSGARAQLWDAIRQHPESVIAVETDAVATTVKLDLDYGEGLGQWELTEYDSITYVQSGIYFASDKVINKARTRGIDVKELDHEQVLAYMRGLDFTKSVFDQEPLLVGSRQFIGITNRRDDLYGQWQDTAKQVRVAGGKRVHLPGVCRACQRRPKARHTMADTLHDLSANPLWGSVPSYRHTLPWLDGPVEVNPEMAAMTSEAIEEFDSPRRLDWIRPNG
jgi:hypothetical protein